MMILILIASIWALLMVRTGVAEYKYYQSVKTLEPDVWAKLGAPKSFRIPFVFVSSSGAELLKGVSNETVQDLARAHRTTGIQFLSFIVIVLAVAIIYFKMA